MGRYLPAVLVAAAGLGAHGAAGADAPPPEWRDAVEAEVVPAIGRILAEPIVAYTVHAQNARYGALAQAEIDALDQEWRAQPGQAEQPLIAAVLSNPTSTYLTRVQAQAIGLFTEIFVMDRNGLNVGQSNISSDLWQGDEAKFQQTFPRGAAAIFVDEPEFRDDVGIWVVQVNTTIDDGGVPIGAATFEVNLTELARRRAASASDEEL